MTAGVVTEDVHVRPLSSPTSKAGRLQRACLRILRDHAENGALPTSARFVFYELVTSGEVAKKDPDTLRLFVPISIEASMDITNIAQEVSILFADARDNAEATAFATGSGSGQPKGVMTAVGAVTASRVSATSSATYGLVDVYKVANALPPRHRPNATWAMENTTVNLTRQFGITGNYSDFTVDLTAGPPSHLLGKPLVESSAITSLITAGNDIAVYGNFQRFVIADRAGMTVEFVPHLFSSGNMRPTGQRGWFAYSRCGSDVTDAAAFRVLRV